MTSNQAIKVENGSLPSPTTSAKPIKPTSSFFGSPSFFAVMDSSEIESAMSPTSILDNSKSSTAFVNPFWSDKNTKTTSRLSPQTSLEKKLKIDSKGVGLGIVDALNDEETNHNNLLNKCDSRIVLFGSQLKIQIPSVPNPVLSPTGSPKSPADFGIKTRNHQIKSPFGSSNSGLETPSSPLTIVGCLSASEMELSEDYTCVISRGPNPKTIHIFGDCIVEDCCGVVELSVPEKEPDCSLHSTDNILSFCYKCKKQLAEGKDIYMYRLANFLSTILCALFYIDLEFNLHSDY